MENRRYKILAIDDDPSILSLLDTILSGDFTVVKATNCNEARAAARKEDFQIVLLDLGLPDGDGMDLLKFFKEINEDIEIIVVTSSQQVTLAVKAIRLGAFDFIGKEFDPDELKNLVNNALEKFLRKRKILYLESEMDKMVANGFVAGHSPKMRKIYEIVERTAKVPANVLLTGESGTGKELIARRLHYLSSNREAPFVALNLASVPAELLESTLFGHEKGAFTGAHRLHYGKFELADGGTLFMDEIGDLRFDLQAKLLRAIQEQVIERVGGNNLIPVKVKIIAATNANLEQSVKEGKFREDLFYRLNVVRIHLPPLRERLEDIPEFVRYFIEKYNRKFNRQVEDMSDLVFSVLSHYSWPGNIRELENLIERLIALSEKPTITEGDIPVEYLVNDFDALKKRAVEGDVLGEATAAFERSFILRILEKENWNQIKCSERLGVHRKTLEYKIKHYDLRPVIVQRRAAAKGA
ncbi:MAG: sigma-54-dependent Fis family transcriptional regulator [Deltaproteobacteria bacterium]|nr:sigma-54-dependent Fis family transcriptional regulator [Deltaproteobacteria bacterium]